MAWTGVGAVDADMTYDQQVAAYFVSNSSKGTGKGVD